MDEGSKTVVFILIFLVLVLVYCYCSRDEKVKGNNPKRPVSAKTIFKSCDALHQISPGSECQNEVCAKGYSYCLSKGFSKKEPGEHCEEACIELYNRIENGEELSADICTLNFCVEVIPELRDQCVDCSIYDLDQCRTEAEIVDAISDANCSNLSATDDECYAACELLDSTPGFDVCASTGYCYFHDRWHPECQPCSITDFTTCTPSKLGQEIENDCSINEQNPTCDDACVELADGGTNVQQACTYSPNYCAFGIYKQTCNPCTLDRLDLCEDNDELAQVISEECVEEFAFCSGIADCDASTGEPQLYTYKTHGNAPILQLNQSCFKNYSNPLEVDGEPINNATGVSIIMEVDEDFRVHGTVDCYSSGRFDCPRSNIPVTYLPPETVTNEFTTMSSDPMLMPIAVDNMLFVYIYTQTDTTPGEFKVPSLGAYDDTYVNGDLTGWSGACFHISASSRSYLDNDAIIGLAFVFDTTSEAEAARDTLTVSDRFRISGHSFPGTQKSKSNKHSFYSRMSPRNKETLKKALQKYGKDFIMNQDPRKIKKRTKNKKKVKFV